jgi:hypothetical protein
MNFLLIFEGFFAKCRLKIAIDIIVNDVTAIIEIWYLR